jgi:hypothetical protein
MGRSRAFGRERHVSDLADITLLVRRLAGSHGDKIERDIATSTSFCEVEQRCPFRRQPCDHNFGSLWIL